MLEHSENGLPERNVSVLAVHTVPVLEHYQQHRHAALTNRARRVALWNTKQILTDVTKTPGNKTELKV